MNKLDIEIVCLEQAIRNSKSYLNSCLIRMKEAEEKVNDARINIRKMERALFNMRQAWLDQIDENDYVDQ